MKLIQKTHRWIDREDEARTIADNMRDPEAKRIMLDIADTYQELVRLSDDWERQVANLRQVLNSSPDGNNTTP